MKKKDRETVRVGTKIKETSEENPKPKLVTTYE